MAYGLRVWDAAGNLTMDTTTNAGRWVGEVIVTARELNVNGTTVAGLTYPSGTLYSEGTITGGATGIVSNGSFTVAGFSTGTPWWIISVAGVLYDRGNSLTVSRSGNTINWSLSRPSNDEGWADFYMIYGVM